MTLYEQVVDFLHRDCITKNKDLAGIVILGSVSSGQDDNLSDIDAEFVYLNDNYSPVVLPESSWNWDVHDVVLNDDYLNYGRYDWRSGAYVTAKVILDKSGEIHNRISKLIHPGYEFLKDDLAGVLDGYYNAFYRSMKCLRRGNMLGANVMAVQSLGAVNTILYTINGYIGSYLDRLKTTISMLETLPLPESELYTIITDIASRADAVSQVKLFNAIKRTSESLGFGYVCESWNGKLENEAVLLIESINT